MPKLRPGTPRRSAFIGIKVTPEQLRQIEEAARREGTTVSEFLRAAALARARRLLDGW